MKHIAGFLTIAALIAAASFRLGAVSVQRRAEATRIRLAPHLSHQRCERAARLRQMSLDHERLESLIQRYRSMSRERLVAEGYLVPGTPRKGSRLLGPEHRTAAGGRLLAEAKDVLYALLFGDRETGARFHRVERELLTLTLPRGKAAALEFMQASTELAGAGTWRDPENAASDERADNVIIEVEYGEIESERIGDGIVAALKTINLLEVNEQVLYARMADVEQSTLVE